MIRVLSGWEEIGAATEDLQRRGLPLHATPQKNWDHHLVAEALADVDRAAPVVDLGCGAGYTLALLSALGFRQLTGVDLRLAPRLRLRWLRHRLGWRLLRRDIVATGLPAASFGAVVCVSTLEHGVAVAPLVEEVARLLRPGGLLVLTTDHREPRVEVQGTAFGRAWRILDRADLEEVVRCAGQHDLAPVLPGPVPPCGAWPAVWGGQAFTFAGLVLRRSA